MFISQSLFKTILKLNWIFLDQTKPSSEVMAWTFSGTTEILFKEVSEE